MLEDESEKLDDITSLPGVRILEEAEKPDGITSALRRAARESGKPRSYREFVGPTWLRVTLLVMTLGGGVTGVMNGMLGVLLVVGTGLRRDELPTFLAGATR